jgi:hypothetical protein
VRQFFFSARSGTPWRPYGGAQAACSGFDRVAFELQQHVERLGADRAAVVLGVRAGFTHKGS